MKFLLVVCSSFVWAVCALASTPAELEQAAQLHRADLPEFQFIKEFAEARGLRVFLFGGSAASYLRYVKLDLDRTQNANLQSARFNYSFYNIFRSTQDVDIVLDGTPEQAHELSAAVSARFPYMQGSRNAWEVRLLRQDMGNKEALLGNPNFLNQHTDSYSVGLVELTTPPEGESPVRDLKDWDSRECHFLKDVLADEIHYYFSPFHSTTRRFQLGLNPPIFSVIRILIKEFQFSLRLPSEDREILMQLLREFKPATDLVNDYTQGWIVKNGVNLFRHAADIELAWNELESLGLRNVLMDLQFGNDDSLEFPKGLLHGWLQREPLRSFPVGTGRGLLASELGIEILAHDTLDLTAIESIRRSPDGRPNQFATTYNGPERQGVFSCVGEKGAKGTGFTVRYCPEPNAREGSDFVIDFRHSGGAGEKLQNRDVVILRNKNAFRVLFDYPSTDSVALQYFRLILEKGYLLDQSLPLGHHRGDRDYGYFQFCRQEAIRLIRTNPEISAAVNHLMVQILTGQKFLSVNWSLVLAVKEWIEIGHLGPSELSVLQNFLDNKLTFEKVDIKLFEPFRKLSGDSATRSLIEGSYHSGSLQNKIFALQSMIGRTDPELQPLAEAAIFDSHLEVRLLGLKFFLAREENIPKFVSLLEGRDIPLEGTIDDSESLWEGPKDSWFRIHKSALSDYRPTNYRELFYFLIARILKQDLGEEDSKIIRRVVNRLVLNHEASPLLFLAWFSGNEVTDDVVTQVMDYLEFLFSPPKRPTPLLPGETIPLIAHSTLKNEKSKFIHSMIRISELSKMQSLLLEILRRENPRIHEFFSQAAKRGDRGSFSEVANESSSRMPAELRKEVYAFFMNHPDGPHFSLLAEYFAEPDLENQNIFLAAIEKTEEWAYQIRPDIDQFLVNMAFSPSEHLSRTAMQAILKRREPKRLFALLMGCESEDFVEHVFRFVISRMGDREDMSNPTDKRVFDLGLTHWSPKIRKAAFELLDQVRRDYTDADLLSFLKRGAQDPDHEIRMLASRAMRLIFPSINQARFFKLADIYRSRDLEIFYVPLDAPVPQAVTVDSTPEPVSPPPTAPGGCWTSLKQLVKGVTTRRL